MIGVFIVEFNGKKHLMSDRSIRDKVIEQSKASDYDWFLSVKELLEICNKPNFNKKYSIDIKVAIVNYFANILDWEYSNDIYYVYDVYNELFSIKDEKVLMVRKKFLNTYINRVTFKNKYCGNFHETYLNEKNKWINDCCDALLCQSYIVFSGLSQILKEDFEAFIDNGLENGSILEQYDDFNISEHCDSVFCYNRKG